MNGKSALGIVILASGLSGPVLAGIEVCNDTDTRRSVALGYEALGGVWTSEGWWGIDPGDCKMLLSDWTPRSAIYYRATTAGGPAIDGDFAFCTASEAFTILGDKECTKRGRDSESFAKAEVGGAEDFTLSLSTGQAMRDPEEGIVYPDDDTHAEHGLIPFEVSAPFVRGTYGEPFTQTGIFGGCEVIDGLDFCEFEVEGWRYHAYYGGGTADAVLDDLQNWPVPTAVELEGDMVSYGDITVEVAMGRVTEVIGGDPFGGARQALQGEWESLDDPASRFRVHGSNVYDYYNGDFMGQQWLTLTQGCEGQGGSVGFVRMELETQDSWCVFIDRLGVDRIEFINPGRGNLLTYRRVR